MVLQKGCISFGLGTVHLMAHAANLQGLNYRTLISGHASASGMRGKGRSPEKTNQMGGAWPTLACSHLASLLQMVPLKPSLPTSAAKWFASLDKHST